MILDMNRIVDIQDIKTATTGDPAEREKATV
jgi:hypothetical protein